MSAKEHVRNVLASLVRRHGYELLPSAALYDWQRRAPTAPPRSAATLPAGAESYLVPGHPRLKELQARYAAFDSPATVPLVWKEGRVSPEAMLYFRGDNAYVWQLRGHNMNVLGYALTAYYLKSIDQLGLLDRLSEDELFGVVTFDIGRKTMSRDLLDSIVELYFLEQHLHLSTSKSPSFLDVGADYGRLAHRLLHALPAVQAYFCTDAVAASTFICEYYLRVRALEGRARSVPLDEIEQTLSAHPVDIALNIHSFSECSLPAITWWIALLARHRVRYLMIAPNALNHGGELLLTNDRQDFGAVIEQHGYRLIAREPKYRDPVVQSYGVNPTYHYLFEFH